MKSFVLVKVFAVMVLCASTVSATTYVRLSINGDTCATTMVQGDVVGWEIDCGLGDTIFCENYLDLNQNHVIDAGDKLTLAWEMADGKISMDGPGDSDSIPDGKILFTGFPISFQAGHYCIRATDKDQSSAFDYIEVTALPSPAASVSGTVSIEGVSAPNTLLEYIMVSAQSQLGMWSGLTDNNGNYTINFDTSGVTWDMGIMMHREGYERYGDTTISITGDVTGINFYYMLGIEEGVTVSKPVSLKVSPAPVFKNAAIEYTLGKSSNVEIGLYNSTGICVKNIASGFESAGSHTVNLTTSGLSSGIYFVKLYAGGYVESKKVTVLK